METEAIPLSSMHIGKKISRIRELRGIKQETLAQELGVSQQTISKLEQSEYVDDERLQAVAEKLGVTVEAIKNFDENMAINIIASNNHGRDNSSAVNYQCTFNPLDKVVQLYDEKIELYERMLGEKKEMIEKLESILRERK